MNRARQLLVGLVAIVLLAGACATAQAAGRLNAYSLQGDFMCVSCHEPLNQVNSPESQAEKQTLSLLVSEGLSFNQIKSDMVNDYGEQVLAQPPAHGISLLVYILPPLVLIAGIALLVYNLPRWRRRARAATLAEPLDATELDPADAARLNAELKSFDA